MVVLDTHVFIWLVNGDNRLKKADFLEIIHKAIKDKSIIIPIISLWEICMLASKGRITLSGNTLEWINAAASAPGINICPLSPEIAYESTILPGKHPKDPADRIIIATARILKSSLITFDKQIIKYSKEGYVKIIEKKFL